MKKYLISFLMAAFLSYLLVGVFTTYANSNIYVPTSNGDLAPNFSSEGTNPTADCLANAFPCVNTNDGLETVRHNFTIPETNVKETYFYGITPQDGTIDNIKICSIIRREGGDSSKYVRNIITAPQGQVNGFNYAEEYLGFFTGERCDNFSINPLTGQKWDWQELQGKNGFEMEGHQIIAITYTYIQIDWTPTSTPSNTPPGTNVVVGPISGVTITYSQVTTSGQTTITSSTSGPTPPSGFKLGNPPTYYSISTTAQFNPPVQICIIYDDTQFKNEKNLKLFHFENGAWLNVTASLDTANNIICGSVSSFSDFALVEDLAIDHLISEVQDSNIKPDVKQGLLDKLIAAKDAIARDQKKTAVNILKAFINQVKAQKDKAISSDQASLFTSDAQALINSLGDNLLSTIFKWVMFGWLDKFINAMVGSKLQNHLAI